MLTIEQFVEDELTEWERLELELLNGGMGETAVTKSPPDTWRERLQDIYHNYIWYELSQPHEAIWEWADAIEPESSPQPFVALWPRGRGKSTHAELIAADLGARGKRQYCGYVCGTQEQADKHVATMQRILESDKIATYFPEVGTPRMGKHGARNWRRNMLIASNDYAVEALGLDVAIRGHKIDWARFDLLIFDDIDVKHDTEAAVKKKEETITTSILPAGAANCAVLFAQNLIHNDSIAHRLSKRPNEPDGADYLADRIVSGPFPAVSSNLKYEFSKADDGTLRWQIIEGQSLWNGFTLEICEAEMNREGPTAFELESQHAIDTDSPDALLSTEILNATRVSTHPDLIRAAIGVDPSGGAGQCGIIGGGVAKVGNSRHGFTVIDYSTPRGTPSNEWGARVLMAYMAIGADIVFVERNFGGDMAKNTIRAVKLVKDMNGMLRAAGPDDVVFDNEEEVEDYKGDRTPVILVLDGSKVAIVEVTASRGKEVRAQPAAALYQQGRCHHVGFFPDLQKQWTQWIPGTKPSPDRLDAEVWYLAGLNLIDLGASVAW